MTCTTLYNIDGLAPDQCILNANKLLIIHSVENLNHPIIIPNVAHMISWRSDTCVCAFLNVYLDASEGATRVQQLAVIRNAVLRFHAQHEGTPVVMAAGGDRNFVVLPEQHISSQNTSWYPGDNHMQSWAALLHGMRVHIDTELSEPSNAVVTKSRGSKKPWNFAPLLTI